MRLTRRERETMINYNAGEREAIVSTSDRAVIRKLDALAAEFPDRYLILSKDDYGTTYSMPKSFISYRRPRTMSDEARERARQRMLRLNERQLTDKSSFVASHGENACGSTAEVSSVPSGGSDGRGF